MMQHKTDHVSAENRSEIMRAVKSRNVRSTEKALRAAMVGEGICGWRMYRQNLPGVPDFVFAKQKLAIFVDGCFWHGCPKCYRRPHSNTSYWDAKVLGNIARDLSVNKACRIAGWRVLRIWEHQLAKSPTNCVRRIQRELTAKNEPYSKDKRR